MLRSNEALLSFAAPSTTGFVGISPKGPGMDAARRQEALCADPQQNRGAQIERQSSRLFFGYFLLAAQKKVSRLRVR